MLAASPCSWFSQPQSNISQSDFRRIIGVSSLVACLHLLQSIQNAPDLPCSRSKPLSACRGYEPRGHHDNLALAVTTVQLSQLREMVSCPTTRSISELIIPFTLFRPADSLFTLYEVCSTWYSFGIPNGFSLSSFPPPLVSALRTKLDNQVLAMLSWCNHFRSLTYARLARRNSHRTVRTGPYTALHHSLAFRPRLT